MFLSMLTLLAAKIVVLLSLSSCYGGDNANNASVTTANGNSTKGVVTTKARLSLTGQNTAARPSANTTRMFLLIIDENTDCTYDDGGKLRKKT